MSDDDDQSFHLEDDRSEEEEAPKPTKKKQHSKRGATSRRQAGKKPPPKKSKVKKDETTVHIEDNSMGEESPDSVKKAAAAAAPGKEKKARKKRSLPIVEDEQPSYDIVLPSNLGNNNGECTVLVQIDPEDAAGLDFVGAVGAIGRMETDEEGVILDMKGCQYKGRIFPGPSAMVLSMNQKKGEQPQFKVDGITDEFCRLVRTGDAMATFDAVVQGNLENYRVEEENVNKNVSNDEPSQREAESLASSNKRSNPASASAKSAKKVRKSKE